MSEFITKRRRAVAALAMVGSAALFGCADRNVQGLDKNDGVVYEGEINQDNERHNVRCYGPNDTVVVREGDSLSILLERENVGTPTIIGGIGTNEISIEVYTQAVANMNDIEDQNFIEAGQSVLLPTSCIAEPEL